MGIFFAFQSWHLNPLKWILNPWFGILWTRLQLQYSGFFFGILGIMGAWSGRRDWDWMLRCHSVVSCVCECQKILTGGIGSYYYILLYLTCSHLYGQQKVVQNMRFYELKSRQPLANSRRSSMLENPIILASNVLYNLGAFEFHIHFAQLKCHAVSRCFLCDPIMFHLSPIIAFIDGPPYSWYWRMSYSSSPRYFLHGVWKRRVAVSFLATHRVVFAVSNFELGGDQKHCMILYPCMLNLH